METMLNFNMFTQEFRHFIHYALSRLKLTSSIQDVSTSSWAIALLMIYFMVCSILVVLLMKWSFDSSLPQSNHEIKRHISSTTKSVIYPVPEGVRLVTCDQSTNTRKKVYDESQMNQYIKKSYDIGFQEGHEQSSVKYLQANEVCYDQGYNEGIAEIKEEKVLMDKKLKDTMKKCKILQEKIDQMENEADERIKELNGSQDKVQTLQRKILFQSNRLADQEKMESQLSEIRQSCEINQEKVFNLLQQIKDLEKKHRKKETLYESKLQKEAEKNQMEVQASYDKGFLDGQNTLKLQKNEEIQKAFEKGLKQGQATIVDDLSKEYMRGLQEGEAKSLRRCDVKHQEVIDALREEFDSTMHQTKEDLQMKHASQLKAKCEEHYSNGVEEGRAKVEFQLVKEYEKGLLEGESIAKKRFEEDIHMRLSDAHAKGFDEGKQYMNDFHETLIEAYEQEKESMQLKLDIVQHELGRLKDEDAEGIQKIMFISNTPNERILSDEDLVNLKGSIYQQAYEEAKVLISKEIFRLKDEMEEVLEAKRVQDVEVEAWRKKYQELSNNFEHLTAEIAHDNSLLLMSVSDHVVANNNAEEASLLPALTTPESNQDQISLNQTTASSAFKSGSIIKNTSVPESSEVEEDGYIFRSTYSKSPTNNLMDVSSTYKEEDRKKCKAGEQKHRKSKKNPSKPPLKYPAETHANFHKNKIQDHATHDNQNDVQQPVGEDGPPTGWAGDRTGLVIEL